VLFNIANASEVNVDYLFKGTFVTNDSVLEQQTELLHSQYHGKVKNFIEDIKFGR
jgi:hypothetical protein